MATIFLSLEFPNGDRDTFSIAIDNVASDQELIEAAKAHNEQVRSGRAAVIGVWEDFERVMIKKFVPVNREPKFSDTQREYIHALAWEQLTSERVEHTLNSLPDYDEEDHESALNYEEAAAQETGNTRAIAYLEEVEDRLLIECREKLHKLPGYAAQARHTERLFSLSLAKTEPIIRKKAVEIAAKTKY